jgi:hypothetical protein
VEAIEGPTDRLTVGRHQVDPVESVAVVGVGYAGHDPVDGKGGDRQWSPCPGSGENPLDRAVVVDGVDQYAEQVALSGVDHAQNRTVSGVSTLPCGRVRPGTSGR